MDKRLFYRLLKQNAQKYNYLKNFTETYKNFSVLQEINDDTYRLEVSSDINYKSSDVFEDNLANNARKTLIFGADYIFLNRVIHFNPTTSGLSDLRGINLYVNDDNNQEYNFLNVVPTNNNNTAIFDKYLNSDDKVMYYRNIKTATYDVINYFSNIDGISSLAEIEYMDDKFTSYELENGDNANNNLNIKTLNLNSGSLTVTDDYKITIVEDSKNPYRFNFKDISENGLTDVNEDHPHKIIVEEGRYSIKTKDINEFSGRGYDYFLFGLSSCDVEFVETDKTILGVTFSKMDNGKISITCNELIEEE